jgi:two-component system OmpR family sensor kinase/two-component system sensor histidine kinase QseC
MNSLRARLLLSLLATLAGAALVLGIVSYHTALRQTETLLDYQLRQMALSLRDQGEIAPDDAAALSDEDLDFVIQIWSIDGRTVYASRVHRVLPARAVLGFADIAVEGESWRTFGVNARNRIIQVAQPRRIRQGLAAESALRGVLPLLAAAPLLASALWWLITRTLRPLSRVVAEVRQRDAEALAPLAGQDLPDEVASLVHSLNALLARIGELLTSQRAFVADAAHELRSPLTALKIQVELVRRAADDGARQAALDALAAGVDRATRLVEQLLTLARSEPGAQTRPPAPVDLAELARTELANAAALASARGTTLSLVADDPRTVLGDSAALATMLRNLVDNAIRYTPPGGQVELAIRRRGVDAGSPLCLRIDDSGPGIPSRERERVFDRFVRGSSAQQSSGTGLGLAIVRSVARRHGAAITLGDAELGGLRVELDFPVGELRATG